MQKKECDICKQCKFKKDKKIIPAPPRPKDDIKYVKGSIAAWLDAQKA